MFVRSAAQRTGTDTLRSTLKDGVKSFYMESLRMVQGHTILFTSCFIIIPVDFFLLSQFLQFSSFYSLFKLTFSSKINHLFFSNPNQSSHIITAVNRKRDTFGWMISQIYIPSKPVESHFFLVVPCHKP